MRQTENILERIAKQGVVLGDGGYLIELERRGWVDSGSGREKVGTGKGSGQFTPEVAIENPEALRQLHREFLNAGSEVLQALTFFGTREKLNRAGYGGQTEAINDAAVRIAHEVAEDKALVAGSVSRTQLFEREGRSAANHVRDLITEQVRLLADAGVDFLILETFFHLEEMLIAIECSRASKLPIVATMTFRPTLTQCSDGHTPADCARAMVDAGAAVVGVNCEQEPDRILSITREMRKAVSVPIAAQPSAFRTTDAVPCFTKLPQFPDEMESIQLPRNAFQRFAERAHEEGINFLGGCCGCNAAYIHAYARGLAATTETAQRNVGSAFSRGSMSKDGRVKVGIIGSQFEADIHAASFKMASEDTEVVAVASPTPGNAAALAKRYGIPRVFTDYREMLKEHDIEMITIAAPNKLHAQMTADIARAGKHVVCEKPLAMTVEECEQMIHVTRQAGVLLMYAEELFFTPKYLKAKEMADVGAFGKIHLVKQSEKHFGPHAEWFWDVDRCGGGALMDLGCHGIAFCYWFLGRPAIQSVYSQLGTYVHADKTKGDDEAYCILEFENGAVGLVENSWGRRGGMDDRIEVHGSDGVTYANLHMGNALPTYSENGYGYAVEKAPSTKGWSYPVFEELWNYGFPQEMTHFARCVRGKEEPQATGEDGLVVIKTLYAAYASAGEGRKIQMPFSAKDVQKPIDLWFRGPHYRPLQRDSKLRW